MIDRNREEHRGEGQSDLVPLRQLQDWQVAEGDPDIRGWNVEDMNGNRIGQIGDLIIDTRSGEAAFADITYGGSLGIGEKHTLVRIDDLRLDEDNKRVLSYHSLEALKSAPEYRDDLTDFTPFTSFWAGVASAREHGEAQTPEREGRREGAMQRFVHRIEPERRGETRAEGIGEHVRKVKVHMMHRGTSGDERPLSEGDILEIPARGTAVIDEIIIRLEAVEEEEEDRETAHHFRV